ncbi:hypothetical protein NXT3_PB00051 (plasmid) [Sinorhizobium fredii]|uniref:Uncharacterized protein n=1 Tax=Rhizobium fredii TaxID=380 RepID=A0A2L0HB59_RHIFR|nr:hypothetical protein NXT3_PB00051 [Sinorhizobium fredii]
MLSGRFSRALSSLGITVRTRHCSPTTRGKTCCSGQEFEKGMVRKEILRSSDFGEFSSSTASTPIPKPQAHAICSSYRKLSCWWRARPKSARG